MGVDITTIKEALTALGMGLTALKQIRDMLPANVDKTAVNQALESAERQISLAEAQILQGLGYELCRNHPIPIAMLSKDNRHWVCQDATCGNTRDTSLPLPVQPTQESKWMKRF